MPHREEMEDLVRRGNPRRGCCCGRIHRPRPSRHKTITSAHAHVAPQRQNQRGSDVTISGGSRRGGDDDDCRLHRGRLGWLTPFPFPGNITTVCTGTTSGTTFTLTADCGEVTSPLTVPDGVTVEGGGHMITATDPVGVSFNGGVVTNAPGAHLMHVNNVIIQAVGFAFHGAPFHTAPGAQLFRSDSSSTMPTAPRRTSLFGTSASTLAAKPATGSVPTRVPGQHARSRSPTSPLQASRRTGSPGPAK